jgi:two-component system response regulator HupR/HoxA
MATPSNEPERPRVLVVDDEPAARRSLEVLLDEEFDVVAVGSVPEAELLLGRRSFEVLVTDYDMPGGTGLSLLRRTATSFPWIVSVLVTGHQNVPEIDAARAEKRDLRVVVKPYDPQSLLGWVRNAASMSRLRQVTRRLRAQRTGLTKP